ncbi:MAG TPA: hypothetical protein VIH90_05390 [Candidatus Saccharimonadales bacterium]
MGLVGSAFEFLGDSLQRQIMGTRISVLDHAEVMLEHYPDIPNIIQPTEIATVQTVGHVEDIDVADIVPISPVTAENPLDAQQIRIQIDEIRREAA